MVDCRMLDSINPSGMTESTQEMSLVASESVSHATIAEQQDAKKSTEAERGQITYVYSA